jgi:type I restriction enzyme S subunit
MKNLRLGDICSIEKGVTGINKAIPGKYPLVVTSEERKSHNEFQFDDEAVIIPLVSSTGHGHKSLKRIHYQTGKFAVGSILCAIIPKDKTQLSAEYLYRYLDLNRERELVSRMKGMANVTLPIKEIAQIEIPVPSLVDQRRFVENYKVLEEKSNTLSTELTHQLDLVKQLRQAFLREAMQGKLVPQDKRDEPASMLLQKIKTEKEKLIKAGKLKKQKELPPIKPEDIPFEIPKSWVWCRLGEITTLITDGKHGECNNQANSGYYFLSAKDIQNGKLQYENARQITYKDFLETHNRTALEPGDLCIVNTGATIGKTAFAQDDDLTRRTTFQKSVAVIKVIKHFINMRYIEFFIVNETPKLLRTSRGSAINNLLLGDMRNVLVPLPPLSEQHHIVTKLEQLMCYCDELEQSIKESQAQNEHLLQQVLREALRPGKEYEIKDALSLAAEE